MGNNCRRGYGIEITDRRRAGFKLRVRPVHTEIFVYPHEFFKKLRCFQHQIKIGPETHLHHRKRKGGHNDTDDRAIIAHPRFHPFDRFQNFGQAGRLFNVRRFQPGNHRGIGNERLTGIGRTIRGINHFTSPGFNLHRRVEKTIEAVVAVFSAQAHLTFSDMFCFRKVILNGKPQFFRAVHRHQQKKRNPVRLLVAKGCQHSLHGRHLFFFHGRPPRMVWMMPGTSDAECPIASASTSRQS